MGNYRESPTPTHSGTCTSYAKTVVGVISLEEAMPDRSKLPSGDAKFLLEQAMPALGIGKIRISWSDSRKKWPDIWCDPATNTITVTAEWRRQNADERRKRLVHECLHLIGYEHGWYRGLEYSTYPDRDRFSMKVYRQISGKLDTFADHLPQRRKR